MKDHTCLLAIIISATIILSVDSAINTECGRLSYRKSIENKPDIIIAQYFEEELKTSTTEDYEEGEDEWYEEEPKIYWGICQFKHARINASMLVRHNYYMKNRLTYDSESRTLYAGYGSRIYEVQRNRSSETSLLERPDLPYNHGRDLGSMSDTVAVTYDWITQNFFVATRSQIFVGNRNNEDASSILVHMSRKKKIVKRSQYSTQEELQKIAEETDSNDYEPREDTKLVVHPTRGYLFVKLDSRELFRLDQDGNNKVAIRDYKNEPTVWIKSIAMDFSTDRLYVLETKQEGNVNVTQIYHMDLDGGDVKTLRINDSHDNYVPVLAVDNDYVYYAVSKSNLYGKYFIYRAGKNDGALDADFELRNRKPRKLKGIYHLDNIFVSVPQKRMEDHPCGTNNGGCQYQCVAVPDKDGALAKKCV